MRKLAYVVSVVLVVVVLSGVGWAVDQKNTGCGLGTMLFEGQNGLVSQTFAVTTNGTFGNQTFGITSGTSNCERYKTLTFNEKLNTFVADNMGNLASDIARGQGEYLTTLAVLMEIPSAEKGSFYSHMQAHFSDIYTSDKVTHSEVVNNILTVTATM
ncbi:MAG: DUF3015 family protein [Thermodesulfobacteriota bacterium]